MKRRVLADQTDTAPDGAATCCLLLLLTLLSAKVAGILRPMPRCDLLLTNATILTMDEQFTVHRTAAWRSRATRSSASAPRRSPTRPSSGIDCGGRVVMPGLVNAHTHVPMSLLRGLADDLRLDVWLMGYMMPVEREFVSPEFVRLGTRLGCAEMIRSGVTCFADMYYFEDAVAEATADAGMRALCGQTVLRFPAPDATSYEEGAGARARVHRALARPSADRPGAGAARAVHLHAGDPARVRRARRRVRRAAAHPPVGDAARSRGLAAPPRHAGRAVGQKQGLFDAKVLAAHCVHVDDGEIRALKNFNAGVAHNPTQQSEAGAPASRRSRACWSSASTSASAPTARRRTTTSTCSRRRGWRRCWRRASSGDPTAVPARDALAMATRLGAARAAHGPPDRIARARQARRPDRARPRSACTTCRRSAAIPTASTPGSSTPRNRPTSST